MLVITPTFTAGFNANFGSNASAAQAAWIAAARVFTTNFADSIHINITVDAVAGTAVIGESDTSLISISVTVYGPRVTFVQSGIDRQRFLPDASVDQTEARQKTALATRLAGPRSEPLQRTNQARKKSLWCDTRGRRTFPTTASYPLAVMSIALSFLPPASQGRAGAATAVECPREDRSPRTTSRFSPGSGKLPLWRRSRKREGLKHEEEPVEGRRVFVKADR
jgi:hypothetical protein